jgi:hypothetical protein
MHGRLSLILRTTRVWEHEQLSTLMCHLCAVSLMSSGVGVGVAAEPPDTASPAIQLLWSSQVVLPAGGSPGGGAVTPSSGTEQHSTAQKL